MADEQGINPAFALAVAERESSFNPYAHASQSIYGLYQMSGPLRYQYGSGNSADPYTQATAWGHFITNEKANLTNRIGREPTDTEMYYAHHFGTGRAAGMINGNYGPSTSVGEVFTPYELSLNPHLVRAGTVGNVMGTISYDMGQRMQRYGGESGWSPPKFDLSSYGTPLEDNDSGAKAPAKFDVGSYGTRLDDEQQKLGLKSDEGSMRGVVGNVGDHADWDKFEREASPSENVEDNRKPPDTSILGTMQRASEGLNTGVGNALEAAAQYGQPPENNGNPLQLQRPGTEVDLSGLIGPVPTQGPNPAGMTP